MRPYEWNEPLAHTLVALTYLCMGVLFVCALSAA